MIIPNTNLSHNTIGSNKETQLVTDAKKDTKKTLLYVNGNFNKIKVKFKLQI